jgi:quinol-cytochrome oxidoreductase complex cytochrome b subunit
VQRHGMSVPPSVEDESRRSGRPVASMPFWPHFVLHDLFGWTVALTLLAALSAYYPFELGLKADPFAPAPAGIRPEWYFLWIFQTLKYMPPSLFGLNGELVVIGVIGAAALVLLVFPFVLSERVRTFRIVSGMAALALAYMTLMTIVGFVVSRPTP